MNKAFLTFISTGAILLASSPFISFAEDAAAPVTKKPKHKIITVKQGNVGGMVTLGGMVIPHRQVNLLAQMPGDVDYIAGKEGDAFSKGVPLVQLDTSALLAKRKQAETQLASAYAGHRNALVQYNREIVSPQGQTDSMLGGMPSMMSMFTDPMRSMSGRGSPGADRHSSIVGQETQVSTAANQIAQAQAAIRELDENIENAIARAPFDGVIVGKMIEVGDIVQPGMPLVTYADTSRMQVQIEVPSRLISDLKVGTTLNARLDRAVDYTPVRVARIFPMAKMGGHTTTVKFDMPIGVTAQSGTYAEVYILDKTARTKAFPVIPETAILWRGSLPAVFLVTPDGNLKMKVLRTGSKTSTGEISVISGVKIGDKILDQPSASTRSGPIDG
ncbi:MAG: efflux RND transporter periplasmic adaptor subunit [Gammaproteobacteria bacterium]|nr:MAG: efflux RND transporter periplasmic adaptor subunit [Gammaproteobacteria bacterium]